MRDRPLVSILINNYNYGQFLDDAIMSALDQTYPNVEVIVVDDGSTDNSREVISRYGDKIIPIFSPNRGQASAYNAGFAASRGELLCFLDSDDTFRPNKVEHVVEALERFPAAGWLRHKLEVTDVHLRPIGVQMPRYRGSRLDRIKDGMCLEHKARFVVSSGIVLRRATAASILPVPDSRIPDWRLGADAYVGMWSAATAPCYTLDETLTYYRRRDEQRLTGRDGVIAFLSRSIRYDRRLSEMWSKQTGRQRIASDVYKHTLVLTSLNGMPLWSQERLKTFISGLRALGPVVLAYPALGLRQIAALGFAFIAPHIWAKRLMGMVGIS